MRVTNLESTVTNFIDDRDRFRGGLILYINENISCKSLQEHMNLPNFEVAAIEFDQYNQTWLLLRLYKPPNQKLSDFLQNLRLILDLYFKNYETSHLLEISISPSK